MALHNFLEIRTSLIVKGLFACTTIPANTIICSITGRLLSFQQTLLLDEKESHCLQIGKHKYVLCDPLFLYSNHSCNHNRAVNSKL